MSEISVTECQSFRSAKIKPEGFWASVVKVYQSVSFGGPQRAVVEWSCGGQDGTLGNEDEVKNFIAALHEAEEIRDKWNADDWPHKAPAPGGE